MPNERYHCNKCGILMWNISPNQSIIVIQIQCFCVLQCLSHRASPPLICGINVHDCFRDWVVVI